MMANLAQPGKGGGGCTSFPLSLLQMCRVRYSWEGRYTINCMVEEPPHVKQLFLIHLCKIGLTANTQIHDTLISPICKQSALNSETMASKAGNSLATCIFRRIHIFRSVIQREPLLSIYVVYSICETYTKIHHWKNFFCGHTVKKRWSGKLCFSGLVQIARKLILSIA
jgi:hypothetical protein